jgi:hypothetical protein
MTELPLCGATAAPARHPLPTAHEPVAAAAEAERRGAAASYAVGGRVLSFDFSSAWAARAARSFISGFHFAPADRRAAGGEIFRLDVRDDGPLPSPPAAWPGFDLDHGRCVTDGRSYCLTVDDSLIFIHPPGQRLIEVRIGHTPRARHPVALANLFAYAIQAALRRSGLYHLHAAAVAREEGGAGVLLVGASGSGKSSLTLRLAAEGWRYLSDDALVLSEAEGRAEALALRRLFAVTPASLDACGLPDAALGSPIPSDPEKRRLEPAALFPGSFASFCVPRTLVLPQVTGRAESRAVRLAPAEVMKRLMALCPWAVFDACAAPGHLSALGRLVRQSRAWELQAGRDVFDDPARAARFVSDLAAGGAT